jgi:kynurenine formamidase
MYKLLSYVFTDSSPGWPGNPKLVLDQYSAIARGDPANTFMVHLHNHGGTHFDAPNHYIAGAPAISELPLDRFIYEQPLLLDIPKADHEKITAGDLRPYADRLAGCDLLLLRTGFSRYRTEDPARYGAEGPGIGSDCAEYLAASFRKLKAVAVDFVSIASYRDQTDGNKTHRILLGGRGGHYICAIEDVNLTGVDPGALKRVIALPFFVGGIDSAPVTIIGELGDIA